MGRVVSFKVDGQPVRWQRAKPIVRKGRLVMVNEKKATASKRNIASHARLAWKGQPVCGPVALRVDCIFAIPKSWPAPVRLAAMEGRVHHCQDPDYDQLVKQVMDALVGIVYVDDNQVAGFPGGHKRYGAIERTEITIHVLDQQPDEITPAQRETTKRAAKQGLVPARPDSFPAQPQLFPSNTEKESGV